MRLIMIGILILTGFSGGIVHASPLDSVQATDLGSFVCTPWYSMENDLQFKNDREAKKVQNSHSNIREYLLIAPDLILQYLENEKYGALIGTCDYIDRITDGFSRPCTSDTGQEIIPQPTRDTCKQFYR